VGHPGAALNGEPAAGRSSASRILDGGSHQIRCCPERNVTSVGVIGTAGSDRQAITVVTSEAARFETPSLAAAVIAVLAGPKAFVLGRA
jgi:hypothetical protein